MRKLLAYDNGAFDNVQTTHKLDTIIKLDMHIVEELISKLREELSARGHCTEMLGKRHNNAIEGMVESISVVRSCIQLWRPKPLSCCTLCSRATRSLTATANLSYALS